MTIADASEGGGSVIFELIAPFSESADARLRGNAVLALAALVGGQDKDLGQRAMTEIVRVMSAEPGAAGALDWQRRFVARSLDALARLQSADRQSIGRQIFANLSAAREPQRRAAIAQLSLAAMEHDRRFWTAGWIRWLRLSRFAARSGFWITVWAVLWRTTVVWMIFGSGAAFVINEWLIPEKTLSNDVVEHAAVIGAITWVVLTISAILSIPGSIRPPLWICFIDTVISAIMFSMLTMLCVRLEWIPDLFDWSTALTPTLSTWDKLFICVLAVVLGGAIRALRWATTVVETEPTGTAVFLRPLAALGLTTLLCIAAGRLGMDMRAAGIGWMVLLPAAVTAAWLDVWLANSEPHPLSRRRARADRRWAIPALAGSAIVLSGYLVTANLKNAWQKDAELSQPAQLMEKAQLPGRSGSNELSPGFGHRIRLGGEVEGNYQFVAKANANEQITLFLMEDSSERHVVDSDSGDEREPPTITVELKKGHKYFVCVMPEDQPSCSLSSVANFRDFDILAINGDIWRNLDLNSPHTISISRSQ